MKNRLPYLFWVGLNLITLASFGQISIDYPSDRIVFQRDKNNSATVYIAGSYTKVADRIEAKLNAMNEGNSTAWITIQDNPQGGFFSGSIDAVGGWYNLEVRAWKGDQIIDTKQVAHVGIGEVFMVAGQSNGQGYFGDGAQGAQDDRVNSTSYNGTDAPPVNMDLPYPQFTHVNADSYIGPRGKSSWSWGRLGDLLVNRLRVPVLFYNVAWYGTSVRAWRESINGTGYSAYTGVPIEPNGMPYGNLRAVMRQYTPITGMRGILWIQGEADNDVNTSADSYLNDLRTVIEASRNESGKNISWVVSLTSYNNRNGSDSQVLDGQQRTIDNVPNVFKGPNTDLIQIPRVDDEGVHFINDGLVNLGNAWSDALNDNFFANSDPFKAVRPVRVTSVCVGNGNVSLNADNAGYTSVSWNNGQSANNIQVGNGTYRVTARDDRGNYIYSPEIRIHESILPAQPTITLEGSNPVCLGNTATLVSSTSENLRWSNGATSDRIPVTAAGEYFVTTKNIYGCESTSDKITMRVVTSPLPAKPKITVTGEIVFCDGGEVNLRSDSNLSNLWSNGANSQSIVVKNSGDYRVRALDNVGCFSPESDPVTVKVNPLPQKPMIDVGGATTFCDGGNVKLTSNYDSGNIWSNAATTKAISATITGNYILKQRDANGCESSSDPVSVKVNSLPVTPAITALRPVTFCDRDYTRLRSSDAFSYLWSNGSTDKEIEIRTSGDFTISARDQNGCVSPASAVMKVVANPLPQQPTIKADGPLVFCADLSVNLQSTAAAGFLWSNGASTQTLNVTKAGTYSVRTINQFQCYSDPSNQITTETLSLPPSPKVEALGVTTFCDGNFVTLKANDGGAFYWSNGSVGDTIHATVTGNYSARIKDEKGCYSPYSKAIPVSAKPMPTVPVIRQTGTYTLLAENNLNAGDHVWKFNNAALPENSPTLKATKSGTYTVNNTIVYSPSLTCYSGYSTPFVFYKDTENPGFTAYPNPLVNGKIAVETLFDISNAEVQVVDSRGVVHKSFKVKRFDSQQFFDLSGLPGGLYIIRVVSSALNASQKLVIVR